MAYHRRSRIPYEETPAGQREAERKRKNFEYTSKVAARTTGLVRLSSESTKDTKDILEHVRKQAPRDKWNRIGYQVNSDGSPSENFFEIPGFGYFIDYGIGGTYYIKPKVYKRVVASVKRIGGKGKFTKVQSSPMLKSIHHYR